MRYQLMALCPTCEAVVDRIYLQGPEDARADAYTYDWFTRGLHLTSGYDGDGRVCECPKDK